MTPTKKPASSFGLRSLKEVVAELEAKPPSPSIPPTNIPPPSTSSSAPKYSEEYVSDPGFRCLSDQLARVRAERRLFEDFKRRLAGAEEATRREADQKKARERKKAVAANNTKGNWVRAFDDEANAEYFYNEVTGEASWLPPPNEARP